MTIPIGTASSPRPTMVRMPETAPNTASKRASASGMNSA
jgi:hypothetical protein